MVINKWQRVFLITPKPQKIGLIFWLLPYAEQEELITPVSLLGFALKVAVIWYQATLEPKD